MKWQASFKGLMQRDGWLLAALAGAVMLCVMLPMFSASTPMTQEEQRYARVLSAMEGAGQVDVAIRCDKDGIPESCVVVAQGAEDALVRLRLRDAAATLLGIDTKQVAVYQRRKEGT